MPDGRADSADSAFAAPPVDAGDGLDGRVAGTSCAHRWASLFA